MRPQEPAVIGLLYLVAFAVYLLVAFLIVRATVRWAKRTGRSPTKWGWVSALAIYLLVFWDHIPTLVAHEVLCRTVPEVKIYKTFEQWRAEHADVPRPQPVVLTDANAKDKRGHDVVLSNTRFATRILSAGVWSLSTAITHEQVLDITTDEVLVERQMVGSGHGSLGASQSWQAMKVWLNLSDCIPDSKYFHGEARKFKSAHEFTPW